MKCRACFAVSPILRPLWSATLINVRTVAFSSESHAHFSPALSNFEKRHSIAHRTRFTRSLCMSSDNGDEDDEDIDPNSLGDWRAFRMSLANSELSTGGDVESVDGIILSEDGKTSPTSLSSQMEEKARPRSVSKLNEQLLKGQNQDLAEEYMNGVWAHEAAVPEVGGLVCRMPLEIEIYRSTDSSVYKKLQDFVDSDEYDRDSTSYSKSSAVMSTVSSSSSSDGASFSALAAKTVFWYRGAEKLLKREIARIAIMASDSGKIDANDLDADSLELLQLYMDYQQEWQNVCLVIEKDESKGTAKTIAINRPMAFKLTKSMARLVLLGAFDQEVGADIVRKEKDGSETKNLVKFLSAFEGRCGIYVGGDEKMEEPAMLVHGIKDLSGAEEISPGTGIYRGGLDAAMDGILSGKYKPLDFRFFVGHSNYEKGELDDAVQTGKYQPIACSRPLVLKQCMQLPKPLWHEVLEFCGGELKEISKLEFLKRDDLQPE